MTQHLPLFRVAEASVRFYATDESHATLTVRNETPDAFLTIIHEGMAETSTHECVGITCTEQIDTASGETLIFIARQSGLVTATHVAEVACDIADLGFILSPRGGFNLIVHQDAVGSREHLHMTHSTGELPLDPRSESVSDAFDAVLGLTEDWGLQ